MCHLFRYIKDLIIHIVSVALLALSLSGCSGDIGSCIDADDFGFAKATVSSRYSTDQIYGTGTNEVGVWNDYGLVLNGKTLMILVKNWDYTENGNSEDQVSAWCPWYGDESNTATLSTFCQRLIACKYNNNEMCNSPLIVDAPCLMKKGVGLYAYLAQTGDSEPNATLQNIKNPGTTFHVGEPTEHSPIPYQLFDISPTGRIAPAGGVVYNYDGDNSLNSHRLNYVNNKLYFKILDSYYDDNNGQYKVYIKSGVFNGGWDPISWCISLVKNRLFGSNDPNDPQVERYGIVRMIYQGIVTNSAYVGAIRGALTLFVMFTAFAFLLGSIEVTQAEVIRRVVKIAIVTALIDPSVSWDFFNQYLFIWFYEGADFIVGILQNVAASGPGSSNPLDFFFSEQIFLKLSSLLLTSWFGWIYVLVYLIMLIFIVSVFFESAVIYMTALIMIGLLICLAPIFVALFLFEATKSFFENWLKQLIGYFVQIVLTSAGVLFMTMILRNQIYNTLGFRICKNPFINMPGLSLLMEGSKFFDQVAGTNISSTVSNITSLFSMWMPDISTWDEVGSIANSLPTIPIPKDHFQTPQDSVLASEFTNTTPLAGQFCSAYQCFGKRYPDLPFLDPHNPYEYSIMNDLRTGQFTSFAGLMIVVVCVYLMNVFNNSTASMAKFLSGTSGNLGSNEEAGQAAASNMMSTATAPASNMANKMKEQAREKMHDFFRDAKHKMIDKPWEKFRTNGVRNEALTGSAAKNVVKRTEESTGLKHTDMMKYDMSDKYEHRNNMASALKKDGMSDIEAKKLSAKLIATNSSEHKDLIAKSLGGAEYSKLSAEQQKKVDAMMQHKDFAKFTQSKQSAETFQDSYLKNYIEMSESGQGYLAKRGQGDSAILKFVNGVKTNMSDIKAETTQARLDKGAKWMNRYDELKSRVTGGIYGNENNEILYNDKHLRTYNEYRAEEALAAEHKEHKKAINQQITVLGRDFQRPEYLAEVRAKDPNMADGYDQMIQRDIEYSVGSTMSSLKMGNTYMQERMSNQELISTIDMMQDAKTQIKSEDAYLNAENPDASIKAELDKRENYIDQAVNSHIHEVSKILASRGVKYDGQS